MELFFRSFGKGPALIILHGLYGSSDNWITIGKSLSKQFEVFIIDQRNHGSSPHTAGHNYMLLKNDLYEFMYNHGIKKAILLGHSMGGKTCMFFASDYPEMVSSLIAIDISPRSYKDLVRPIPHAIDHMNIMQSMMEVDLSMANNRIDIDRQLALIIKSTRIRQFLLKNIKRDKEGKFSWKINLKTLHDQMPLIMDGMDVSRFIKGKGITGFPVLFIKGENSNYITEEDIKLIHKIFPAAEIVSIPSAGHWLHAEQPELLLKTIRYFLS